MLEEHDLHSASAIGNSPLCTGVAWALNLIPKLHNLQYFSEAGLVSTMLGGLNSLSMVFSYGDTLCLGR
jgi:hypothetical protein